MSLQYFDEKNIFLSKYLFISSSKYCVQKCGIHSKWPANWFCISHLLTQNKERAGIWLQYAPVTCTCIDWSCPTNNQRQREIFCIYSERKGEKLKCCFWPVRLVFMFYQTCLFNIYIVKRALSFQFWFLQINKGTFWTPYLKIWTKNVFTTWILIHVYI